MQSYHWMLISAFAVAFLCSWKLPRAWLWLTFGAASYVVSASLHVAGYAHAIWVGVASNVAFFLALFMLAEEKWELRVWQCVTLMLLLDALRVVEVATQLQFAVALEIVNMVAMAVIAGTGIMRLADGLLPPSAADRIRDSLVHRSLFKKREPYPRWWES